MSQAFDWSTFLVRININAPMEKLYRAWATRTGIEYWFLRVSEYKNRANQSRANDGLVENMKSLFEGGVDLRNKNMNLQQVLNA